VGVGPGTRVLAPTYHCPTMIAPVEKLGAEIVFYPINAAGGPNMAWLDAIDTRGVRALLAAHFFGIPQPMQRLRWYCDQRGIALIEDCAHAFFGRSDGRPVGAWGDFAIASLTKFFPVNEGGLLLSTRGRLTAKDARGRGWLDEARSLADALEMGARHGSLPGINRLLQAVFGSKNLLRRRSATAPEQSLCAPSLDARAMTRAAHWIFRHTHRHRIVTRRRQHYNQLVALLSGAAGMHALMPPLPPDCAPYVMPLFVASPDALYQALRRARMPVFRWCQRWPDTPEIEGDHGGVWSRHVLQLGCHQDLSDAQITELADTLLRQA